MVDCSKCQRTDVKCCYTCNKDANKCKVWHNCGSDCPGHESRIVTNADKIRSMTDEELAEKLVHKENDKWICSDREIFFTKEVAIVHELNWLQQEAEV